MTGCRGYIGQRLCAELKKQGWELNPYCEPTMTVDVDVIFHLAALTRNDRSIQSPIETMNSNVMLSTEVFELARESKVPVVYTSSAVIYSPIRTPYQISKKAVDELAQWYNEDGNGGDIRIVRLADVIGPGMTSGPIAAWREQYKRDGVIDVWEGVQRRRYVYIDDAVRALINAVNDRKGTYNVGSIVPFDITCLARLLKVPYRIVPALRPVPIEIPLPDLTYTGTFALEDAMEIVRREEFVR